ncbi:MAG TPA: hypothetical protein VKU19_27960 [Bryobacteraceae bacterium]|nr:hypothetical protein [Bryobacteraceae bacterium]
MNFTSIALILTGWLLTTARHSLRGRQLRRIVPGIGVSMITAGIATLI